MSRLTDAFKRRPRREQLMIAAGSLLLVVVIAFVALGSGGGGEPDTGSIGPALTPKASATPTVAAAGGTTVASGIGDGRDPFEPLVGPGSGGGTGTGGSTAPSSGGPTGSNPSGSQRRVTLIDIFTQDGVRMASVSVGDTQYTVKKGQTFATNFKVVDLNDKCATFLFGDERFSLCTGQEILK